MVKTYLSYGFFTYIIHETFILGIYIFNVMKHHPKFQEELWICFGTTILQCKFLLKNYQFSRIDQV